MKKLIEVEFTQKMADELNELSIKLGIERDYKPHKFKVLFG